MGHQDLITALRSQGASKADAMRRQTDEEAARIVGEGRVRLDALEKEAVQTMHAEKQRLIDAVAAQAKVAARRLLAASRGRLATRLSSLAGDCLLSLRNEEYEASFARLAAEIPAEKWQRITVNPADKVLASKYFPGTPVVEDGRIVGGFELISKDGLLQINNTLEKRLERSLASMLPAMVTQLERECMDQ